MSLKRHGFESQQCLVRLEIAEGHPDNEINRALKDTVPIFEYYYMNHGLCLPAACTPRDVQAAISKTLENSAFRIQGKVTCDTHEKVDFDLKIKKLTFAQNVAM